MGIKFFDYDNDGRPDLFITDMHSDMAEVSTPEREKLKNRLTMTEDMLGGPKEQVHLRQLVLRESRQRKIRGDLGSRGRGKLLAVGAERRATSTRTAGRTSSSLRR